MNSTPSEISGSRYSLRPLERLSITRSVSTRPTNCSTRCEPMNDVPPVTNVRAVFSSISAPCRPYGRWTRVADSRNGHYFEASDAGCRITVAEWNVFRGRTPQDVRSVLNNPVDNGLY